MCYECANPECFYVGALLGVDDVNFVHVWNSQVEDLDLSPRCPSCAEPMMVWDEQPDSEVRDGALQKKISFA